MPQKPMDDSAGPTAKRERGVDRILQIMDFLHARGEGIRIGALAKELNAPRSSTYALINALLDAELLEMAQDDGRVFFGKRIYLYGLNYIRENPLARRARQEVDRLAKETGETSEFCMLQGGRYTIIHMCPGNRPFRISSAVGMQIPIPWTASGQLLLAGRDRAEIEALIAPEDLVLPDSRRIDLDDFIASIEAASAEGFSRTIGLIDAYTQCLAAAIYSDEEHVEATICLVLPIDSTEERVDELSAKLKQSARLLSAGR